MWTELVADFEARISDAAQAKQPLTKLAEALKAVPSEAAMALRLARAWRPLWAGAPPPISAESIDFTGFSTEAKAELAACSAAGLVSGPVPEVGGAEEIPGTGWREVYIGGSPEAEAKHNARIAEQVKEMQRLGSTDGRPRRAFHAKGLGLRARFTVASSLPPELQVGLFQPGRVWDAAVRLSNAASPDDDQPNLHGLAVRIFSGASAPEEVIENNELPSISSSGASAGSVPARSAAWRQPLAESKQDFLATSAPVSHVNDAAEQALVGAALAQGTLKGALKLLFSKGPGFTFRVLGTLSKQTKKRADSLATLSYYSRAPFRFGPIAARFAFRPLDAAAPTGTYSGPHRLTAELTDRLKAGPARFELVLQRFVTEAKTPIEQGDSDWTFVPSEPVGVLEILQQDLDAAEPEALAREVEGWAFSPLNTRHHTPLGRLNRGRAVAYEASVVGRGSSIDR